MRIPKTLLTTLEGLLWAVVGGAATSVLEIQQYMTNWKDFDIDYAHVARLAGVGAILGGSFFLRDLAQRRNVAAATAMAEAASSPRMAGGMAIKPAPGPPQQPGD